MDRSIMSNPGNNHLFSIVFSFSLRQFLCRSLWVLTATNFAGICWHLLLLLFLPVITRSTPIELDGCLVINLIKALKHLLILFNCGQSSRITIDSIWTSEVANNYAFGGPIHAYCIILAPCANFLFHSIFNVI